MKAFDDMGRGTSLVVMALWIMSVWLGAEAAGQASLAAALEGGSLEQRHKALLEVLDTPPDQRDPRIWAAVIAEMKRALAIYHRLHDETLPEPAPSTTMSNAYYEDLQNAVAQSRDPAVIPLLVDLSGYGGPPSVTLVRFGDLAVPALLVAARGTTNDLGQQYGARFALAAMCRAPIPDAIAPVSAASREQIVRVAQELWNRRFNWDETIALASFAIATGDPDLRRLLERLAVDPSEWKQYGIVDPEQIAQVQAQVQAQLNQRPPQ